MTQVLNSVADKAEGATRKITGVIPMAIRAPIINIVNSDIVSSILICTMAIALIVGIICIIIYAVKKDSTWKSRAVLAGTILVSACAV